MFWRKSNRARNRRKETRSRPGAAGHQLEALDAADAGAGGRGGCDPSPCAIALNQPLRTVSVEGRFQRVQPLDVEKAVRQRVGKQGLVAVDLDAVGARCDAFPGWIAPPWRAPGPAACACSWSEQTPVARWGESGLLNTRGELFVNDARHIPPELPELVGPPGSESLMTTRYLAVQGAPRGGGHAPDAAAPR